MSSSWYNCRTEHFLQKGWVDLLSRFPNLEVFRGGGLWLAVGGRKDQMHLAIMELVQRCTKLRQIDHCDYYAQRNDWKRIVIIREGLGGGDVRYEVRKPPPRYVHSMSFSGNCLHHIFSGTGSMLWTGRLTDKRQRS